MERFRRFGKLTLFSRELTFVHFGDIFCHGHSRAAVEAFGPPSWGSLAHLHEKVAMAAPPRRTGMAAPGQK